MTSTKLFAPNLTKSDQVNKVLAEGMTEKDEFLYANGGGAEALWKLIDLEAQHRDNPQSSRAGEKGAREGKGAGSKFVADSWVPLGNSQQTKHGQQNQVVLFNASQQQVAPPANPSFQPLLQQSSAIKKMFAQVYSNYLQRRQHLLMSLLKLLILFFRSNKWTKFSI